MTQQVHIIQIPTNNWHKVAGYEGLYWVDSTGKIKNPKRIRTNVVGKNGYVYVDLYKNNIRKKVLVHRLVAQTFLPNPNNYPNVCHKDDNPLNNTVDNLFWGTQKMNVVDMMTKKRNGYTAHTGESNGFARLSSDSVISVKKMLSDGIPCSEIAKIFNVDRTTISSIKRGITWRHLSLT